MVVKQPALVVREGAVEESRHAALRLRVLLPTVDIDRWAGITHSKIRAYNMRVLWKASCGFELVTWQCLLKEYQFGTLKLHYALVSLPESVTTCSYSK